MCGFWKALVLIRKVGLSLFTLPGNKAGPRGLQKLPQVVAVLKLP